VYPAIFLIYFVSAAVILHVSLALIVRFSLLYNSWNGYHCGFKKIKIISLIYHLSNPRDLLNLTEIQWSTNCHGWVEGVMNFSQPFLKNDTVMP